MIKPKSRVLRTPAPSTNVPIFSNRDGDAAAVAAELNSNGKRLAGEAEQIVAAWPGHKFQENQQIGLEALRLARPNLFVEKSYFFRFKTTSSEFVAHRK